jgi:hypothetical protein
MNDLLPPWIALDLFWEQVAIEGISALDENRGNDAAHLWHTAELLCASFDAHDPRRAATMTNQGAALEQQGRTEEAETRYREALVLWDGVSGWIERMTVELQAKSAHFHRRLEVRHGPELKKLRRHIQGRLNQGVPRGAGPERRGGRAAREGGGDPRRPLLARTGAPGQGRRRQDDRRAPPDGRRLFRRHTVIS